MKSYEYSVAFVSPDILKDNRYFVIESPSNTTVYRGDNSERAYSLAALFNSGKGFQGFTPAFMLVSTSKASRNYV